VGDQLPYLRGCLSSETDINDVLDDLPETLKTKYEGALCDIKKTHRKSAAQLFQCIAVASRPLTVKEAAEVFAFDFDVHPIPKFREEWHRTDSVQEVLSACSSLLTIVQDTQVVQFSHPSVKKFLTSNHLPKENDPISYFRISTPSAHTFVAKLCLGMFLHLPEDFTSDNLKKFPLAGYAAKYWVDHARFEGMSQEVEDGMTKLFDPLNSHLAVWTRICDRTVPHWSRTNRSKTPSKPSKFALHYAAFYGLLGAVNYLITKHSQDLEAHGFSDKCTALYVALVREHFEVARALLKAVTTGRVGKGEHAELTQAQALLELGGVATAQNEDEWTLLHFASDRGHLELVRALLEHGADATARNRIGQSPLDLALSKERRAAELARVLREETPLTGII